MRSCYEKVKSKFGSKTGAVSRTNNTNTTTTTTTTTPQTTSSTFNPSPSSASQSVSGSSPSRSSARHAKCLKPISYSITRFSSLSSSSSSKSRMRKQGSSNVNTTSGSYRQIREQAEGPTTSTKSGLLPGTAPIAQIRSLPLHLSHIRSFGRSIGAEGKSNGHRSSYIINTTKVRNIPNIKRSRSLSPEILRNTGSEPLKSPTLVRSAAVSPKKPHKTVAASKTTSKQGFASPDKIPTREEIKTGTQQRPSRTSSRSPPATTTSTYSPYSTYNLVKSRNNNAARLFYHQNHKPRVIRSITKANTTLDYHSLQRKTTGSTTTPTKNIATTSLSSAFTTAASTTLVASQKERKEALTTATEAAGTTKTHFPITSTTWPKRKAGIPGNISTIGGGESLLLLLERRVPKALEHQELYQRHHEEELSVISATPEKGVSKEPSSHLKMFGSHLLLGSGGGSSVGGGGGGSRDSGGSRHHHHHHHQTSSRSNGPSGRRKLNSMDMQSPTSARVVANSNANSHGHHNRSLDGGLGYPPGIYANHPKPLAYYRNNSGSVASSIYSEPVHRSHPQPYKQGLFGGQRGTLSRQPPPSSTLFDDDPGIMSEAETSSTGFRRGGKARSSLPVVRTPSKTLERPLGTVTEDLYHTQSMVFLQYRSETKRALLPNEITSMDTVRALFVRSFPKQLTMEYLDAMSVKIYIHDGAKDMFYELEDLRDIRDRSVLRLFEPNINGNGNVPSWDQDQSYFSEPEFDSDYQHQHIHKTKGSKGSPYNMTYSYPVGATLPRVTRSFSPAPVPIKTEGSSAPPKPQRQSQYPTVSKRPVVVSPSPALYSPRGGDAARSSFPLPPTSPYTPTDLRRNIYSSADPTYIASPERRFMEDPYYQFPPPRSGSITPVIIDEEARVRMEHMERQLANLTGLVQKALVTPGSAQPPGPGIHPAAISTLPRNIIVPSGASQNAGGAPLTSLYRDYIPTRDYRDDIDKHSSSSSASLPDDPVRPSETLISSSSIMPMTKPPKFGKEKSVSFSDDPPDHGKQQHSPTHQPVEKPTKPAIKSSTLPRMSQDRVLKPVPSSVPKPPNTPVQPPALVNVPTHPYDRQYYSQAHRGELGLSPEMYNQLRMLQKKAKELKTDIKFLRRSVQAQAHTVRETLRDTFLRFKVVTMSGNDQWMEGDPEKSRIRREEELYKQEVMKLEKDLSELELTVEDLRSHVINKRTRVNMSDVENMALILSKSSKSVADLKVRFPPLHESVKTLLTSDMDRLTVEDRFLKEEPERLESALKRCKKLTGTLVTLKRLASVQEQRLPSQEDSVHFPPPQSSQLVKTNNRESSTNPTTCSILSPGSIMGAPGFGSYGGNGSNSGLDPGCPENALDDLLNEISGGSIIPQKNRLGPPAPPKRLPSYPSTESGGGSPVRNWDSPLKLHPPLPPKPTKIPPPPPPRISSKSPLVSPSIESSGGDSSESVNSQDGGAPNSKLSQRHQELLRKQRQLQEQYNRLQMLQQRGGPNNSSASNNSDKAELKKTGSESNLRAKLGLEFSAAPTGSLSNINKHLYETDIL